MRNSSSRLEPNRCLLHSTATAAPTLSQAKITEVHAQVSAQLPKVNVTEHVGAFVGHVDGEIRPWLAQTLSAVPQLKKYGDDPVALQAIVYCIIGAPVVLLFSLLLSCCCR